MVPMIGLLKIELFLIIHNIHTDHSRVLHPACRSSQTGDNALAVALFANAAFATRTLLVRGWTY